MALTYTTKEAVLAALETALKTVSWITTVDRQHSGLGRDEDYEDKGCFVHDLREARRTVCLDCIVVNWSCLVSVYIQNESTETLATDMNAAIEQVKNAIQDASALRALIYGMKISMVDTGGQWNFPQAMATFDLEIMFLSAV